MRYTIADCVAANARAFPDRVAIEVLDPRNGTGTTPVSTLTFADVWRRVVWQNPDLNYELKRPVNNAAIAAYTSARKTAEKRTLDDINKEWGLFFFFRSDCPYCHRLAPTLKFLTDTYGITVFPVSVDPVSG